MPSSPPTACLMPGCPNTVASGQGAYCKGHRGEGDKGRGNRHERGYGNAWGKVSRRYLRHHPVCCDPYDRHPQVVTPSYATDHIKPRAAGGGDEWANFQALCKSCHAYKTLVIERERG